MQIVTDVLLMHSHYFETAVSWQRSVQKCNGLKCYMSEHLHMLMTVDKCALLMIFFHGSFYLNCCHVKKNDPTNEC